MQPLRLRRATPLSGSRKRRCCAMQRDICPCIVWQHSQDSHQRSTKKAPDDMSAALSLGHWACVPFPVCPSRTPVRFTKRCQAQLAAAATGRRTSHLASLQAVQEPESTQFVRQCQSDDAAGAPQTPASTAHTQLTLGRHAAAVHPGWLNHRRPSHPAQISASCNCSAGNSGPASSTAIRSSRWESPLAGQTSTTCSWGRSIQPRRAPLAW